ncbi:MAG: exo-alpha-sialidase [Planctomycetes bacterium]|nr:exo-alpha-sialidase [Planctomycetota bacterium]
MRCHLTSSSFALAVLLMAVPNPGAAEPPAPFRAADGLFDKNDLKTLGLKTISGQHTMLYRAPDDGYRFCHHPNLVVFRGRIYCMWSNGKVNEDDAGQRILFCHTSDGKTWSKPRQLTDHRGGQGICVAAGWHVDGETLVAFYTTTEGSNFQADTCLRARTSRDGETWSDPKRLASGFYIESPQPLAKGRLLMTGEHVGDDRKTKRMKFLITDDVSGLAGWREVTMPAIPPGELKNYGYTEPSFFHRTDGTLVASLRNYTGFLYTTASRDKGDTWSQPVRTDYFDSTARTSAGNLPAGPAFLINNAMPKRGNRSLLTLGLSDDGVIFDRAWIVRGEPTKMRHTGRSKANGWQYPHAISWKNSFYVAYSINKEDVAVTRISLEDLTR